MHCGRMEMGVRPGELPGHTKGCMVQYEQSVTSNNFLYYHIKIFENLLMLQSMNIL